MPRISFETDVELYEGIVKAAAQQERSIAAQVRFLLRSGLSIPVKTKPENQWEVHLLSAGDRKINVIKEVRALTMLGLKEAKDLTDSASPRQPQLLQTFSEQVSAIRACHALEGAGAVVQLVQV